MKKLIFAMLGLVFILSSCSQVVVSPKAPAIAAGGGYTCVLTKAGEVKCWGKNYARQQGDGGPINSPTPVDLRGLNSGVAAIGTASLSHSCVLTVRGEVKCWGDNLYGQLGTGNTKYSPIPVDVSGLGGGVTAIAVGPSHNCALAAGGAVKCWGFNRFGQLGNGSTAEGSTTPVDVSGLGSGVTAIAVGSTHTCALTVGGGVKCWGWNVSGQLGNGSTADRPNPIPVDVSGLGSGVIAITAGSTHTCALTVGAGVKCWGNNRYGQLGTGNTADSPISVDVSGLGSGVTVIVAGSTHTCALTVDGGVKCWGWNVSGQLGNGSTTDSSVPLDVSGLSGGVKAITLGGNGHTCALTVGGGVKCWGWNAYGQLGDGSLVDSSIPVDVSGLGNGVAFIAAGDDHTCAVTNTGGVKCWGWIEEFGQFGNIPTAVPLPAANPIPAGVSGFDGGAAAVAVGGSHACVVTNAGGVKCWGNNLYGQLGNGSTTNSPTPVDVSGLNSAVTAIAVGSAHACALTVEGGVKCWGSNEDGQLGNGIITPDPNPTPVDVSGLGSRVIAITAGDYHTCALTMEGGVKCWGWGADGQLGTGNTADSPIPVDVSGLGSGVTAIAAGGAYTCALTVGGGVKCWGMDAAGQLGDGGEKNSSIAVNVSGLESGVTAITAGYGHTCALMVDGGVKCWGWNGSGELGNGSTAEGPTTPVDVSGLGSGVTAITAGENHTCALLGEAGLKCWGSNAFGQLGNGTMLDSSSPVDVIGFGTALEASLSSTPTLKATAALADMLVPTSTQVVATSTPGPTLTALPSLQPGYPLILTNLHMINNAIGWGIEMGGHIVRSRDGGKSWQDVTPGGRMFDNGGFFPLDADTAWATPVHECYSKNCPDASPLEPALVWHTSDGGQTWQPNLVCLRNCPFEIDYAAEYYYTNSMQFLDKNTGWLEVTVGYLMSRERYWLYRTTDGGKNWDQISDNTNGPIIGGEIPGIAFLNVQTGWFGLASKTVDGGRTWDYLQGPGEPPEPVPFPAGSGQYHFCEADKVSVLPPSGVDVGYGCAHYHSPDGGKTWYAWQENGGGFLDPNKGWRLLEQGPGRLSELQQTGDGGRTWDTLKTVAWQKAQFDFVGEHIGWAIVTTSDVIALLHTTDGGRTWTEIKPIVVNQ